MDWRAITLGVALGALCGCAAVSPVKQSGMEVPAVSALNQHGKRVDLAAKCSGEWGVVFFYPEADTPG